MVINTKPDYDKLNELYEIALNNNRLLVEKHKKEIAGHVARNRSLENEIKRLESDVRILDNERCTLIIKQLQK